MFPEYANANIPNGASESERMEEKVSDFKFAPCFEVFGWCRKALVTQAFSYEYENIHKYVYGQNQQKRMEYGIFGI